MHSNRMRTVRCSGRLAGGGGGVCPGARRCLPRECLTDTPPWTEHYLAATTLRTVKIVALQVKSTFCHLFSNDCKNWKVNTEKIHSRKSTNTNHFYNNVKNYLKVYVRNNKFLLIKLALIIIPITLLGLQK